jgi:hypothetical protein
MATINASAVISSAAAGADFNDTITLTDAGSSDSGIGTFWFAWVPGEDFLDTPPVSVSPPPGWTANITNEGPNDGFAIQFVANSPASDVQPGSSLNFSFTTADSPAALNGNSVFFPNTPVETAFVYPQGPFSDAGHQLVVTPATIPAPTPTPTPTPSPTPTSTPPVTVTGVHDVTNRKHQVTGIVVDLSGPVNAGQADNVANYVLATATAKGSFTGGNSNAIRLGSAVFNPSNDTVTLTPRKAFALSKPVQLTINGSSSSGLQDGSGQRIDGEGNGSAGSNAVVVLRRGGVTLNPVATAAVRASRPSAAVLPRMSRPAPFSPTVPSVPPLASTPVASTPLIPVASVPPLPLPTQSSGSLPTSYPAF